MKYKQEITIVMILMIIGGVLGWTLSNFMESKCFELKKAHMDYISIDNYDEQILTEDYIAWKYNNCFEMSNKECKQEWGK